MRKVWLLPLLVVWCWVGGCERAADPAAAPEAHAHDTESPSGATFEAGRGIILTEETREILGVTTSPVGQQNLPVQTRFNLQVFDEKHHHSIQETDHTGCDVYGAGFLPPEKAAAISPGETVEIIMPDQTVLGGRVLAVEPARTLAEAEVIVGLTNAAHQIKPGEFLSARITQARDMAVLTIPRAARLQTSEGTFVYRAGHGAYARIPVTIGAEARDQLEVTAGLQPGDTVVTHPVEALYLIELRITKGGGHAH
ncbi:MAG TPA: efflux RND transporter periplasmic adaptor subunit [Verrucomicrobiota bacterium]|nr:efflux RND transporter periplasmic adaptor subunit [Verrucomicrobiota bacterium]HNT15259.1 efflux RND transporter periplasmic adaptor subunit [Verrucomicrobiota bacterium]